MDFSTCKKGLAAPFSQLREDGLKVFRQFRFELHALPRDRMVEPQPIGMQAGAFHDRAFFFAVFAGLVVLAFYL